MRKHKHMQPQQFESLFFANSPFNLLYAPFWQTGTIDALHRSEFAFNKLGD
ncbi:MAG TPA: hypothetical protein VN873_20385 [Candidatus Angelobacter sp.]|nr:hypothetical protein [Candidatus Angelobacter sp.]